MKRFLLAALTFAVAGTAAYAQQAEPRLDLAQPDYPLQEERFVAPAGDESVDAVSAPEVTGYFWFSRYGFPRPRPTGGDSNLSDLPIPLSFGTSGEIRGVGQVFAPKYFYNLLRGKIFNEGTDFYGWNNPEEFNDVMYIEQFKNAGVFSIDTMAFTMYKNFSSNNPPPTTYPGGMVIYKTQAAFDSATISRSIGYKEQADKLEQVFASEYLPEGIDTTLTIDNSVDPATGTFSRTQHKFDPPLEFEDGSSAIIMYQQLEAPAQTVTEINAAPDVQRVRLFLEAPAGTGRTIDFYRTFGVLLRRTPNGIDSVMSAYRALTLGGLPAVVNTDVFIAGAVELGPSGVKYHFGTELGGQGVNAVSPNPVTADTRIPFTLTQSGHVTLDLFATGGQLVRNLVDATYVPGNYSAPLKVDDLQNGVYLVRMIAGTKVYTQKIIVNR
jgi:hypothetical protein